MKGEGGRKGDPEEDRRGDNKCQEAMGAPEGGSRVGPVGLMVRRRTERAERAGNSPRKVVIL